MVLMVQMFLENVEAEIRDVVRRLGHHPSIVLWSANNENQVHYHGNVHMEDSMSSCLLNTCTWTHAIALLQPWSCVHMFSTYTNCCTTMYHGIIHTVVM